MSRLISAVVMLFVLVCDPATALESDQQQKIYIESDELEIDELSGESEYRGKVSFTRGSIHLTADKARMIEKQGELQKMLAWGEPVHLRQQREAERGETRAVAKRMEYLTEGDRLFLYGEAHLWQEGNEFSGDVIEYHLADEKVVARGDQSQSGRVHIIIEPKTKIDSAPGGATGTQSGDTSAGKTVQSPEQLGENPASDKAQP